MLERELLNRIAENEECYIPSTKKHARFTEIKEENGRKWAYGIDEDGKKVRVDIRHIRLNSNLHANEPTAFEEDEREKLEEKESRIFEAARLLGQNKKYILQILRKDFSSAMYRTMMTKVTHNSKKKFKDGEVSLATVRLMHYANAALIAGRICEGLFPNDDDLKKGVEIATIAHDIRQTPFGHDGETACNRASEGYGGGPFPHGSEGARALKHRYYSKLRNALIKGNLIEEEANRRLLKKENASNRTEIESYEKKLKQYIDQINESLEIGLETDLMKKINERERQLSPIIDDAINILITAAGNHNGERAREHIKPDYSISTEEFWDNIKKSYTDSEYSLVPCSIIDAIAKICDQISSIPFDMIDGVRSGIEDSISEKWALPVSKILHISLTEARERLRGDNRQLNNLALEIQDSLVENVIKCSNPRELNMDLAEWLYGLNGKTGLRSPNMEEHIHFTTLQNEQYILDNLVSDLTDVLVQQIVDENGILNPRLNSIFRLDKENTNRSIIEESLRASYTGNEYLRDWYSYCTQVTSEEYKFHKDIIKGQELEFFRDKIKEALRSKNEGNYDYFRKYSDHNSTEYAIGLAFEHDDFQVINPDKNGQYSDQQIKEIIENINLFYKVHPEYGIQYLQVTANKKRYSPQGTLSMERKVTRDQQIAARIAITYIMTLNDYELLELAKNLDIITQEQLNLFYSPYTEVSEKRKGGNPVVTRAAEQTAKDYTETTK